MRSILWVGRGEQFAAEWVQNAATLDVVWTADPDGDGARVGTIFDAIVLDVEGAVQGLAAITKLRTRGHRAPLLLRLSGAEAGRIPDLLAAGAADVLLRDPGAGESAEADRLRERLDALLQGSSGEPRRRRRQRGAVIVGNSAPMRAVFDLVERAGSSRATVLVTGETGTGKELIARATHDASPRHNEAFVALNCAAFPDTLLESELFGHVRGAFTGADRERKGLFEVAARGSIFLDEISETSAPFQAKLLRVLQERELRPVGGTRSRRIDVRVIAATNRELRKAAGGVGFREDLYYRLAVFPIHVPPLRERTADIVPLAEHFLRLHGEREQKSGVTLSKEATRLLHTHPWPGNVRELENEIQRALALADPGDVLVPRHFSERLFGILDPIEDAARPGETLRQTLDRVEALLVRRALDQNDGRRTRTARSLGITREGLYKKMQRLRIE